MNPPALSQLQERAKGADFSGRERPRAQAAAPTKATFGVRRIPPEQRAEELTSYASCYSTYDLAGQGERMHVGFEGKKRD